jgi:hypothetical protein
VVELGDQVLLDGTRSSDPDGDRLGHSWELEARPLGSTAAIEEAKSPLASLTPDVLGVYVVSLTVTDGGFVRRDLLGVTAIDASATSTAPLSLALVPQACNADLDRIEESPCGVSDRRVVIDPVMLDYPPALENRLAIEWTFIRLPLGADVEELSMGTPLGPLGEMTFVPPRPGEYWISARLIGPNQVSPAAVAAVGVFDDPPPAASRPLPAIEAPLSATTGQLVLFDGRDSFVPTSSTGERPRLIWSLVTDPSRGEDAFTDVATGCPVDECRRLIPSERGQYLVSLAIEGGVTAISALEVR